MALFGFGGGLVLAPLTDTVMAAVPVEDAGVRSAVNDISRELGGALGVAVIGTIVNGLCSSNVAGSLAGTAPRQLVEGARDGIGGAVLASGGLAERSVGPFLATANRAFVDAIATGFRISAGILVVTLVVVFTLLPTRMGKAQAGLEAEGVDGAVEEAAVIVTATRDSAEPSQDVA